MPLVGATRLILYHALYLVHARRDLNTHALRTRLTACDRVDHAFWGNFDLCRFPLTPLFLRLAVLPSVLLPTPSLLKMFRTPIRRMATAARQSLKIGLIPADGIGKEVIPAARTVLEALGSDIPKPEFIDLLAGWEVFARSGTALPEETVE